MIKPRLIAKQSELFTVVIAHPRDHIEDFCTYCHFAVIYGRSPIVLAMPADIAKLPEAEKRNALLQRLALTAFTDHPLNGVTK